MTRDDVIRMAQEAGGAIYEVDWCFEIENLERFAALVAAAEREACARVCDAEGHEWDSDGVMTEKNYAAHCAAVIRTRGNQ